MTIFLIYYLQNFGYYRSGLELLFLMLLYDFFKFFHDFLLPFLLVFLLFLCVDEGYSIFKVVFFHFTIHFNRNY